jgi:hypothetical protein
MRGVMRVLFALFILRICHSPPKRISKPGIWGELLGWVWSKLTTLKTGHFVFQNRPLGVKIRQYPIPLRARTRWDRQLRRPIPSQAAVGAVAAPPVFVPSGQEASEYAAAVPPAVRNSGEAPSRSGAWHRAMPFRARVWLLTFQPPIAPRYVKSHRGALFLHWQIRTAENSN